MSKGVAFPFEQTNIPIHTGMPFAKFGWNWPSGTIEDDS